MVQTYVNNKNMVSQKIYVDLLLKSDIAYGGTTLKNSALFKVDYKVIFLF